MFDLMPSIDWLKPLGKVLHPLPGRDANKQRGDPAPVN